MRTKWVTRCLYNEDGVVLFRFRNLGAFLFELILGAVLIESAVVFALIRYTFFWIFKYSTLYNQQPYMNDVIVTARDLVRGSTFTCPF